MEKRGTRRRRTRNCAGSWHELTVYASIKTRKAIESLNDLCNSHLDWAGLDPGPPLRFLPPLKGETEAWMEVKIRGDDLELAVYLRALDSVSKAKARIRFPDHGVDGEHVDPESELGCR